MKTIDFNQRTVVVTGGTGGIGRVVVRELLEANAKVAVTYRGTAAMEDAKKELSPLGTVKFYQLDTADVDAMRPVVAQIVADLGEITGLVQCAGGMGGKPGLEITPADWDALMNVNARGTFFFMQAVVDGSMKKVGGSIVNIASMAGIRGMCPPIQGAHYGASKAAVVAISMQAAVEWAELGIRCNSIAPGGVKTGPMAKMTKEELAHHPMTANVPMRDLVAPECIADSILYLLSDMSASLTGQCLVIDGGSTACGY